jgi:hypothetical protein
MLCYKEVQLETRAIRTLTLYFDAEEGAAADIIGSACERSLDLIRDLWGLEVPAGCRVYVMTSWLRFLFHAAPWPWRIYLAATLPLRYGHIHRMWAMAGGWALRYGQRRAIGIKPPRLLQEVGAGLRERVFVRREVDERVQHNTCHELVHVCSDCLHLPTWLHEGLAMVTVDCFAGRPTVKAETLETLEGRLRGTGQREGHGGFSPDPDSLLHMAVRGYWIARYLSETQPLLLRQQLAGRKSHAALEGALASGMGMDLEEFWSQIDMMVISHFSGSSLPAHTASATGEHG